MRLLNRWRKSQPPPAVTAPAPISIADAAEEMITLEVCPQTAARFAHAASGAPFDLAANPFRGWETEPATLRLYRLRNVAFDRNHMVLLKDGHLIRETAYLQPPDAMAALRVDPDRLLRSSLHHPIAGVFDHFTINYYHGIAHSVPTLHAILQHHAGTPVTLMLPSLSPWQSQLLAAAGAASLPSITAHVGEQYACNEFTYVDLIRGTADYALSSLTQAAYARISAVPAAGPLPDRIYIDRSTAKNRRLANEPALIEALTKRGFTALRLETLDFPTQVTLFRGARMIVAPHGAGLVNIAFCEPGALVYELVAENYRNPCFLAQAMNAGLRYWADEFPNDSGLNDFRGPWPNGVDISRVLARVEEMEG